MIEISLALIISAFIAGLLTFLAPCTLPLLPAYLGFISGVSTKELEDPAQATKARRKVFLNGLVFTLGFSFVFIVFGTLAGLVGQEVVPIRHWLARLGGVAVMLFGLVMLGVFDIPFLKTNRALSMPAWLKRGHVFSSFIIGGAFAFGWTPCVGPILGSILVLASSEQSALAGAFLLAVFSLGLAIPFLLVSLLISQASRGISRFFAWLTRYRVVIIGVFGIVIGFLANLLLVALSSVFGLRSLLDPLIELFLYQVPYVLPIITSLALGWYAYRKPRLDVLGFLGGVFMVVLGIFLATSSFGLVVQYGYQLFALFGYEGLIELL